MKNRIKVYVAGPYSGDNVLSILQNIGRGEKACAKLFTLGFAPFCPWHDKSYVMDSPDTSFGVEDFQEHSMVWLRVSEAVLVIGKWEKSNGVMAELREAKLLGIPIFYSINELFHFWACFEDK